VTASDLTDAELERLRECLPIDYLSIEDVRAFVMRLSLDGWRLVRAPHLEAELARALRLATHALASEMQSIATRFDAASDLELLIGHSPHLRDDLLSRWLIDHSTEGDPS
jgi:hypothetical protein